MSLVTRNDGPTTTKLFNPEFGLPRLTRLWLMPRKLDAAFRSVTQASVIFGRDYIRLDEAIDRLAKSPIGLSPAGAGPARNAVIPSR